MKQSIDGKYRSVRDSFWTDIFVIDLSTDAKLFYLWLFTNQHLDTCGCYQVSLKTMEYETGLSPLPFIQMFVDLGKIMYEKTTKEMLLLKWKNNNKGLFERSNTNSINAIRAGLSRVKTPEFIDIIKGWLGDPVAPRVAPTLGTTEARLNLTEPISQKPATCAQTREANTTEARLRECIANRQAFIIEKYPWVDIEIEIEEIVAKFKDRQIGADPWLIISRWLKNLNSVPKERTNDRSGIAGGKRTAATRATGIIPPNPPETDWLGGSSFDTR